MKTAARQTKRPATGHDAELLDFNCKQANRPLMRALYRRAQAQLRKQQKNQKSQGADPKPETETQRLVH
jgi:hypothetical protein